MIDDGCTFGDGSFEDSNFSFVCTRSDNADA
jgi:hypothetical protein